MQLKGEVMRSYLLNFCSALLLLIVATNSFAQTLKLNTGNQYPPFSDQEILNGGIATQIVKKVFTQLGYDTQIDFLPWKRGYKRAKENVYLGTFPWVKNEKRAKDFNFSRPIITTQALYFVRKDSAINAFNQQSLQGKILCRPIGWNISPHSQPLIDKKIIEVFRAPNLENCFKMLALDRVQIIRSNVHTGWFTIKKLFALTDEFRTLSETEIETYQLHLLISKSNPDSEQWIARFNKTLDKLEQEGFVQEVVKMHLANGYAD